jgi:hypothetical protein
MCCEPFADRPGHTDQAIGAEAMSQELDPARNSAVVHIPLIGLPLAIGTADSARRTPRCTESMPNRWKIVVKKGVRNESRDLPPSAKWHLSMSWKKR